MFLATCEVFTKNGWKLLPEEPCSIPDVFTFDPNSGKIELGKFTYKTTEYVGKVVTIQNRLLDLVFPELSMFLTNQQEKINCYCRFPVYAINKKSTTSLPVSGYYEGSEIEDPLLLYLVGIIISKGRLSSENIELFIEMEDLADHISDVLTELSISHKKNSIQIGDTTATAFKIQNYKQYEFSKYFNNSLHPNSMLLEISIPERLAIIEAIMDTCSSKRDRFIFTHPDKQIHEFIRDLLTLSGMNSYYVKTMYSGLSLSIKPEPFATVHHSNFDNSISKAEMNSKFISGKNKFNTVVVKCADKICVVHTDNP
jgi:hypothetical protein